MRKFILRTGYCMVVVLILISNTFLVNVAFAEDEDFPRVSIEKSSNSDTTNTIYLDE